MTSTVRLPLPSEPAQVHHMELLLPPADARRHALAGSMRAGGVVLVVGALTLAGAGAVESRATPFVLPIAWTLALAIGALGARAGARSAVPIDEDEIGRARAWLFAGLALIGPLTLHALVQTNAWAPGPYREFADGDRSFTRWVFSSVVLTGLSHVMFAALCAWRGRSGRRRGPHLFVVGAAAAGMALPAVLFYAVFGFLPVAYVALTSVPLLYGLRALERRLDVALPLR